MDILLIEDDPRVADFILRGLRAEGWTVTAAGDAETGLALLAESLFDAVVLDIMLPGMDGTDACRALRARHDRTPILMLTALDGIEDRVAGLQGGADDYLSKPFAFDELVARIGALVRRSTDYAGARDDPLEVGGLAFDPRSLEVTLDGEPLVLTATERELLKLFMLKAGQVLSRERILNTVWGTAEDPLTNIVDVYVGRLRRKLGRHASLLRTVRGAGYSLDRDARTGREGADASDPGSG